MCKEHPNCLVCWYDGGSADTNEHYICCMTPDRVIQSLVRGTSGEALSLPSEGTEPEIVSQVQVLCDCVAFVWGQEQMPPCIQVSIPLLSVVVVYIPVFICPHLQTHLHKLK